MRWIMWGQRLKEISPWFVAGFFILWFFNQILLYLKLVIRKRTGRHTHNVMICITVLAFLCILELCSDWWWWYMLNNGIVLNWGRERRFEEIDRFLIAVALLLLAPQGKYDFVKDKVACHLDCYKGCSKLFIRNFSSRVSMHMVNYDSRLTICMLTQAHDSNNDLITENV